MVVHVTLMCTSWPSVGLPGFQYGSPSKSISAYCYMAELVRTEKELSDRFPVRGQNFPIQATEMDFSWKDLELNHVLEMFNKRGHFLYMRSNPNVLAFLPIILATAFAKMTLKIVCSLLLSL